MKNCAATLKWNNNFANVSATTFLPYPRVRNISPRSSWLQELPRVALRAYWKINRDRRSRLVSSNRDRFALPILHQYFTFFIRGGPINASSGFGLWAKTLRGQKKTHNSYFRVFIHLQAKFLSWPVHHKIIHSDNFFPATCKLIKKTIPVKWIKL